MDPMNQLMAVEITPEGLCLTYMRVPADVRKNGLAWQHRVLVPRASDYDDEIEAVMDALLDLLDDVLDDERRAEPIELDEDEQDEDEEEEEVDSHE